MYGTLRVNWSWFFSNLTTKTWEWRECRCFDIFTVNFEHSQHISPFSTNVSLLYPLKTLENWKFSDVFRGNRSGKLVENGLINCFNYRFELTSANGIMISCLTLNLNETNPPKNYLPQQFLTTAYQQIPFLIPQIR